MVEHAVLNAILRELPLARAREQARREGNVELLAITGAVFNSAVLEPRRTVAEFRVLHQELVEALGRPVSAAIVP